MYKIKVEREATFGKLRFKRFDGYVYRYENNQKTEDVLGAFIIVESIKLQENIRIKLLNIGDLLSVVANSEKLFDRYIDFEDLTATAYVSYNRAKLSLSATNMRFLKND